MSMALVHEVRELRERIDAMRADGPALRAEVEARIAGLEKALEDAIAKVFSYRDEGIEDQRAPIEVPQFPQCLRDLGLSPPAQPCDDAILAEEVQT